jgi:Curli production assembly/transport component CsgG
MNRSFSNNKVLSSFACLLAITIVSCNYSKRLIKDGSTLEQGGLKTEAFSKYETAYYDYSNVSGLVGMKRIAQSTLDSKFATAQMMCMSENYDDALTAFENAFAYKNQMQQLELNTPMNAYEDYTQCKQNYIAKLYTEAERMILNEEYSKAQNHITKILYIDRNNQKAQYLDILCTVLPNYNAGKKAMELGMWREGFVYFDEVCQEDAGFKDAIKLRAECLKRGAFAVAYKTKDNKNTPNNIEEALATAIKGNLLKSKNPFLELLERDDLDVVIQEQHVSLSPQFDSENSNSLGQLKLAEYILSGEIVYFKSELLPVSSVPCDCGSKLGIYSDKVDCFEIRQKRTLNVSYKYQLIDAVSGKLYISDVISFETEDNSLKYEYEIKKKFSITSPTLSKDHDVNLSGLKNTTPDILLAEQDLMLRMYAEISNKVANAMEKFSP